MGGERDHGAVLLLKPLVELEANITLANLLWP
jgi:hypothetical protein